MKVEIRNIETFLAWARIGYCFACCCI